MTPEELRAHVAAVVREFLAETGYSRRALARQIGVSRDSLNSLLGARYTRPRRLGVVRRAKDVADNGVLLRILRAIRHDDPVLAEQPVYRLAGRTLPPEQAAAYEAAVAEHYETMTCFFLRVTRHPADAADLAQEVFLQLWQAWPISGEVRPWLFRVAYRDFWNYRKAQQHQADWLAQLPEEESEAA